MRRPNETDWSTSVAVTKGESNLPAMGIQAVSHIAVGVRDMDVALPFYTDVLGFELQQHWPATGDWRFACCAIEGQAVMFGSGDLVAERGPEAAMRELASEPPPFAAAGRGVTVYVQVRDVDAHHAAVVDAGARVLHAPSTEFYGVRVFHVKDPNGYTLAFYSPSRREACESCGDGPAPVSFIAQS